ncbi:hypothetical protein D9M70_554720 [compost metagenome]
MTSTLTPCSESQRPRMTFCWLPPDKLIMSCLRDGVRTRSLAMKRSASSPSFFRSRMPNGEKCRRDEIAMFSSMLRPWTMPSNLRSSGHSTMPARIDCGGLSAGTIAPSMVTVPWKRVSAP